VTHETHPVPAISAFGAAASRRRQA
jgi:hypothetical protein